jgi:hypothetical protein
MPDRSEGDNKKKIFYHEPTRTGKKGFYNEWVLDIFSIDFILLFYMIERFFH